MTFHPAMTYGPDQHKSRRELPEAGPPFEFTPENRARLEEIAKQYPADQRRSAIMPALYLAQEQQGHITANAMRHVAEAIGCSPAEVEDVVSFYTMYYTRPMGRFVLQVCRTLSCALLGAERVTGEICRRLGIRAGETDSAGDFTLVEVECLGACDRAPLVMVNDHWHERVRPEQVGELLDALRATGETVVTGCHLKMRNAE